MWTCDYEIINLKEDKIIYTIELVNSFYYYNVKYFEINSDSEINIKTNNYHNDVYIFQSCCT